MDYGQSIVVMEQISLCRRGGKRLLLVSERAVGAVPTRFAVYPHSHSPSHKTLALQGKPRWVQLLKPVVLPPFVVAHLKRSALQLVKGPVRITSGVFRGKARNGVWGTAVIEDVEFLLALATTSFLQEFRGHKIRADRIDPGTEKSIG